MEKDAFDAQQMAELIMQVTEPGMSHAQRAALMDEARGRARKYLQKKGVTVD